MDKFAKMALEEYNSEENLIRPGGVNKNAFWNANSSQFIFVPSFNFPMIPAAKEYEFLATDSTGKTHSFCASKPTASLAPIWKDIAVGIVELKVEAIHGVNGKRYLTGARTFYKAAPFPGRSALPQRARSYKECAIKALEYVFYSPSSQYWLNYGKPDPDYYHNVYPSKMIHAIVNAMIELSELKPEMAEKALKLATNAADYLLSITYGEDTAVEGLPPTYSYDGLKKDIVDSAAPAADGRQGKLMLIYPSLAGEIYLKLEKVTGDSKYFAAAEKIANYYKENVLPNGSWYLLVSVDTNKPIESDNCCGDFSIIKFLDAFYKRTGEECWKSLAEDNFNYIVKTRYETFNWEGQFEDAKLTGEYINLTHFLAGEFAEYVVENGDEELKARYDIGELIRYVEDQFTVWGDFAPWSDAGYKEGESYWYSPAAMEQYFWYVPIDSSTSGVMNDFLLGYKLTKNELLLEKACALGDAITRMQNSETGVIPTHWMKKDCAENLENFWINCNTFTAFNLMKLAKVVGEI